VIAAIARRELRGLFVSAIGWTWLAVAVALTAWMLLAQLESFMRIAPRLSLADGAPGVTDLVAMPAIEAAGLLGILLVPLLGIRLFTEDLRSGRIALWLSAPVPLARVVVGKYFGGLGLLALFWLVTAGLLASLQLGTGLDAGKLAAGLLGLLLLFAAALAAGSLVSLLGAQPAATAAASYGLLLLLWMVGGDGKGATRWLAFGSRFQRFLDGVVYAEDVLYFVLLTVALLGLAVLRLALLRSPPAEGAGSRWPVWLLLGLLVATLALALRVGHRYGGAWDLTAGARQSLAPQSRAVVSRLAGPVRVTAIVPDAGGLRVPVQQLLDRYRRARPDVSVQFLDPDLHPEQARQLGVRLPAELLIEHGGRSERVARISEQAITASLQRLSLEGERWVVGVSGHGEADLLGKANFDLGELGRVLTQAGYRLQPFGPADGPWIPGNTALLVLAAPRAELLPARMRAVLDYLEGGGNLLWLIANDSKAKLADLAAALGVRRLPGVVVDAAAATVGADAPTVAVVSRYPDHPAVSGLTTLSLLPGATALEVATEDWTATPILSTGAQSWNETGPVRGDVKLDAAAGELPGPLVLGWALTRPRPGDRGEQRVVVVGDADFLSNAVVGNAGNLDLGVNLVRWLAADDRMLDIPSRSAPDKQFEISRTVGIALAATFLFVLPLGLLATGLLVRFVRGRR
jgi:hypothetical protein